MERFLAGAVVVAGSIWILSGGWEEPGMPPDPEQRVRDTIDAAVPEKPIDWVPWLRIVDDGQTYLSPPRRSRSYLFAGRAPEEMTPLEVREAFGQLGVAAGLLQTVPVNPWGKTHR